MGQARVARVAQRDRHLGEFDREGRAGAERGLEPDRAARTFDRAFGDRQTKTRAADFAAFVAPVEAFECVLLLVGRHPRAGVGDADDDALGRTFDPHVDPRLRRIFQAVFDDVDERFGEIVLVGVRVREGRAGDVDRLRGDGLEAFDDALDERDDIDVAAHLQVGRRFHPGENDQFVDQPAHALGLGAHPRSDAARRFRIGERAAVDDVEVAHDDGERCAQFMPGVGDEALHLALRGTPFGEGRRDRLDRRIVGSCQVIVGASRAGHDRARREVAQRQTMQGLRGFVQRPQRRAPDPAHVKPEKHRAARDDEAESERNASHDCQDRCGLGKDRDRAAGEPRVMYGFARQRTDQHTGPIRAPQTAGWAERSGAARSVADPLRASGRSGARFARWLGTAGWSGKPVVEFALRAVQDAGLRIEQRDVQSAAGHALHDGRGRGRQTAVFGDVEPGDLGRFGGLHRGRFVEAARRRAHRECRAGRRDEHEDHDREDGGAALHRIL